MTTRSIQETPDQLRWYEISAAGLTLGRLSSRVAIVLRGKHKPTFTPHTDNGDFVIITDAEKVVMTGNKWRDKKYYRHSGYPGGLREESAGHLRDRKPEDLIRKAVEGMLPHNALGRKMAKKLKVFAGSEHPHKAQNPEPLDISQC
ncbi:MAG TPA: 50S ribosomal protein L13 [Armatimonadota bacterium]